MKTRRYRWIVAALVVLGVVAGIGAVRATVGGTERVTVLASWEGAEGEAFERLLSAFTEQTGIEVSYQGTRGLSQVLRAAVRSGTAPHVAVLPNPGEIAGYARAGSLAPLDEIPGLDVGDEASPRWLRVDSEQGRQLYAVAVKADLKSLVWYRDLAGGLEPPRTGEALLAYAESLRDAGETPWCLGMGAPPTSGWPGSDWIEDILLHQAGREAYARWAAGELAWTSDEVTQAWQSWGELLATGVHGGTAAALLTGFGDAAAPMFANPAGCHLEHQASFIMGSYESYEGSPRRERDFRFFLFPPYGEPTDGGAVFSADSVAMFDDTPAARRLVAFLASEPAQRQWAGDWPGSVFFLNDGADWYEDGMSTSIAELLATEWLCFDASDLMPATMANAFYHAVLEYLHAPYRLEEILWDLDQVRVGIPEQDWLDLRCGQL